MRNSSPYLFDVVPSYSVQEDIRRKVTEMARNFDELTLLSRSTEDLIAELIAYNTFAIPNLLESDIYTDAQEVKYEQRFNNYDISFDRLSGSSTVISHVVDFYIPFEGDGQLFSCGPSTRTIPGPFGSASGQELVTRIVTDQKSQNQVSQLQNYFE